MTAFFFFFFYLAFFDKKKRSYDSCPTRWRPPPPPSPVSSYILRNMLYDENLLFCFSLKSKTFSSVFLFVERKNVFELLLYDKQVCDTEEAYSFEMSRISKTFDLTLSEVKERCAAIAGPFYQKALGSAAVKYDTVKAEQLARARKTLGMDEDVAMGMHKELYK